MGVNTHTFKQHTFVLILTLCLRHLGGIPLSDVFEHEFHAVPQSLRVIRVSQRYSLLKVYGIQTFRLPEVVVQLPQILVRAQLSLDQLDQLTVVGALLRLRLFGRVRLHAEPCLIPLLSLVLLYLLHEWLGGSIWHIICPCTGPATPHGATTEVGLAGTADG